MFIKSLLILNLILSNSCLTPPPPDRDAFTDDHTYECGDQKTWSTYLFLKQGSDVVKHEKTDTWTK